MANKNRKIGVLWLKTYKKDGKNVQYFSGVLNDISSDVNIVVFHNGRKEKETDPGYIIYRSEKENKKEEYEGGQPVIQERSTEEEIPTVDEDDINTEDIPF